MKLKITESIEVLEQPGSYHIPAATSQGGAATLCAWVDVPHVVHDIDEYPVNCQGCLGIVKYCKKL